MLGQLAAGRADHAVIGADRIFVGHIAGINDVVGLHEAVDDYVDKCS